MANTPRANSLPPNGSELEVIPRWPGVPIIFQPPPLPHDEPYDWQEHPDDKIPRPDVDHWIFDAPNSECNGNELCNPGPLQVPCPNEILGQAYRQVMLGWERGRDAWVNQPPRQGEADRLAAQYPVAPPIRPDAPTGTVRTPLRQMLWGPAIQGVDREDYNDREQLNMREHPGRLNDREWIVYCQKANVYRALTPFYECNALLDYPLPKDGCVVCRWAGVKRSTPAATAAANHPIFTCAIDLDGLLRLAMWQGGMIFSFMSTVFYNYNLSGGVLNLLTNYYVSLSLRNTF